MKYVNKRMLAIALSVSTLGTIFMRDVNGSEQVQVSINNVPTVDIALTMRNTNVNIENFEKDLRDELKGLGVDDSNFKFQLIDTLTSVSDNSDANSIISQWQTTPFGIASNWYFENGYLTTTVNEDYETGFIDTRNGYVENVTLSSNIFDNDNGQPVGYVLRLKPQVPDSTRYNGYYLWVSRVDGGNYRQDYYNYNATYIGNIHEEKRVIVLFKFEGLELDYNMFPTTGGTYAATPLCAVYYNGRLCLGWPYHPPRDFGGYPDGTPLEVGRSVYNVSDPSLKTTILGYKIVDYPSDRHNMQLGIQANYKKFKVTYQNQELFDVIDNNAFMDGYYGFFEFSHISPRFYNMNALITYYKEYKKVLLDSDWRDSAHHVVVNIDDTYDEGFSDSNVGEILSRTLNDKIHFIQWGTDENKESIDKFISKNENKGKFIDNRDYANCIRETALYIKNLIEQDSIGDYVLIDQKVSLDVAPDSLKNDAISTDYPDGRWLIGHDYKFFKNDLGIHYLSGKYIKDLICEFNKTGKYEIKFDDQLVNDIKAHRRPMAKFEAIKDSSGEYEIDSRDSYDLDTNKRGQSDFGLGIAEEEWDYQIGDADWVSIDKSDISDKILEDKSRYIIVRLTVTDYQGERSTTSKVFNTDKPIGYFRIVNNPESINRDIEIVQDSYSPSGAEIVKYEWEVYRSDGSIHSKKSGKNPIFNFSDFDDYKIKLRVTDSNGMQSDWYSRTLHVEQIIYDMFYEYNWSDRYHEEYPETKIVTWKEPLGELENPTGYYELGFNPNGNSSYYTDKMEYAKIKSTSTFLGWFYDTLFTVQATRDDIVENREPFNIYAKWQNEPIEKPIYTDIKREYTIEYIEGENGSIATSSNASKTSDTCTYDFLGWYDGDDLYSKGGDRPILSENKTLDAHWKANTITLPDIEINSKDSGRFLGWFTEPQNYKDMVNAQFVGNPGDEIVISVGPNGIEWTNGTKRNLYKCKTTDMYTPFKVYAWYNKTPVFVNLYDGLFFEGQEVSYSDLLELIGTWDYEKEYKEGTLETVEEYFKDLITIIDNEASDVKDEIDFIIEQDRENLGGDKITDEIKELRENLKDLLRKREELESARRKAIKDVETRRLEPIISKIEYSADNQVLDYHTDEETSCNGIYLAEKTVDYDKTYIDTSTNKIGWLDVTYQVHDDGIWYRDPYTLEDDSDEGEESDLIKIPNSDITVEYTRKCQINFNYNPLLNLQNMIYQNSFDFEGKDLSKFVLSRQAIADSEDLENNTPWWSIGESDNLLHKSNENTRGRMQSTLVITGINEILFNPSFENEKENKVAIDKFREEFVSLETDLDTHIIEDKSDILDSIYDFKDDNSDYHGVKKDTLWNNITGISLTFDGNDQFGKFASNKKSLRHNYTIPDSSNKIEVDVTSGAPDGYKNQDFNGGYTPKLVDDEYDLSIYQTNFERTVWLLLINISNDTSLSYTRVKDGIRYINYDYYNDILGESYWGTTQSEKLKTILLLADMDEDDLDNIMNNEYTGSIGNSKINIRDYTQ